MDERGPDSERLGSANWCARHDARAPIARIQIGGHPLGVHVRVTGISLSDDQRRPRIAAINKANLGEAVAGRESTAQNAEEKPCLHRRLSFGAASSSLKVSNSSKVLSIRVAKNLRLASAILTAEVSPSSAARRRR